MDLGDVFSSNTKTTFVAGTSTSDYIKLDLEDVVNSYHNSQISHNLVIILYINYLIIYII